LGALAASFNTMVENLRESRQALAQLNTELEKRVEERTLQLQTTNRELETFSYSVSHDLRSPLARISGLCELLVQDDGLEDPEEVRRTIERIDLSTREMDQLIEALLSLSQVTSGEFSRETLNLSNLVQTLAEELRQRDPGRKIEFNIAPGIVAQGDRSLLLVVLANLLGNAWKFTSRQPHPRIEFGFLHRHGQRAYFVRDNGAGFDMSQAEKLFAPFQRLHDSEAFSGTGIGLATVQRIIHRHGGLIWAEGAVGQGATFFFTLAPRVSSETGREPPQKRPGEIALRQPPPDDMNIPQVSGSSS
jgi:light-regulated signal transduction histidine kinase (bacteriophytochrome)